MGALQRVSATRDSSLGIPRLLAKTLTARKTLERRVRSILLDPADADPIEFHVEVTPLAPGSATSSGYVRVQIVHTLQPNGPECSPTSRGREGRITLGTRE